MGVAESFFMAVALSVDAFVCSVLYSKCRFAPGLRVKVALLLGSSFGLFQFLMPVAGFFAGVAIVRFISSFDHYIAFALLAFVAFKMAKDAFKPDEEKDVCAKISYLAILALAVATSIDALAVGVSVGLLSDAIFISALIIGVTCFCISFAGAMLGQFLSRFAKLNRILNLCGAAVLFGIGVKILIDHHAFA